MVEQGNEVKDIRGKPTVKLIGQDGNAFSIMGRVKKALMQAGADEEYIAKLLSKEVFSLV